jgi:hypothetical protein
VKDFILDPWEDDLQHLSLRRIAQLEGEDQTTILDRVTKRQFPKPDGGTDKPWWLSFTYRRYRAKLSRPGSTAATTARGHAALLEVWQEYWGVDVDDYFSDRN